MPCFLHSKQTLICKVMLNEQRGCLKSWAKTGANQNEGFKEPSV